LYRTRLAAFDSVTGDETARDVDRRGVAGYPLLINHLTYLLGISQPPNATWRSATVVLSATSPEDAVAAQVVHLQDLAGPRGTT
jgi:hypothetical protein